MTEIERYIDRLRTALAISTSVLAGDDNANPEVIVAENRALLRESLPVRDSLA